MSPTPNPANAPLSLLQVLEPSGGGSGRHVIDLCGGLATRGHAVTAVYSPVRAEPRFVEDLLSRNLHRVIALPMERAVGPWDAVAWWRLREIIGREGPFDIIHGHSSKAGALTRLRLPGRHTPRVYTPHAFRTMDPTLGRKGRLVYGAVERFLGRHLSDRVICVSNSEYDHAISLGIPPDKLRVVVNGVAPIPSDRRGALRAGWGISEDAVVFGFVGRLQPQKAPERLVAAFARIAARMPQAFLLMIGSGEMEPELRRQIAASGFSDRIRLTSELPGNEAIQAFDALVMPSRYEAMSYVMLEAATAGKPLILTEVGGVTTVLEDGVNGILVGNDDDPTELAAAMASLGAPATRTRLTANAEGRAGRYGLDVMVNQTLSVYRELVARPAGLILENAGAYTAS
ncbi:glycosyltransferase involved in cell wall biosynthesis [Ciceribacter lividus]|uniref:Glycosyltransferase involved in cell wall biosynthesis n=1 Tax=Ciceribacter lividus TaxID=1197950 RepID=A0A6I7HQ19_9HYPH|nr:glycosyltransferase family 4 protein [Ciceribacter lividus]RCW27753.1 glycosyltransferase involved in cell wall biosynthesis [Ciceribacter lividus]